MHSVRSPQLNAVLAKGRERRFVKNEVVTSTDAKNDIILVAEGYIKRYLISNSGSLGVQIIYGPQDVFPLTKVYTVLLGQSLYDGPEVYYYQAMSDVQVYTLDEWIFMDAVQKNPLLYKELFSEAGHHLKSCVHGLENIALSNSFARVAHELLFYAKEFGQKSKEGIKLALPLTHQDIADSLGVSRETTTKAIVGLRQLGILGNRDLTILDMEALEREAYQQTR